MRKICIVEKYIYTLFDATIELEDYTVATVYGITISEENNSATVDDISNDFNFVLELFDMIVEGELCPEHLEDVVEDYLS